MPEDRHQDVAPEQESNPGNGPPPGDAPIEGDVTALLSQLAHGGPEALDRLIPVVYDELRDLARNHLRIEMPGHTLQTTALVNEAYLRLSRERKIPAESRVQFFGVASHAMRRVLVDYARKRKSAKRGGGQVPVDLDSVESFLGAEEADELLALDRALDRLKEISPRATEVVQHRFFGGLTLAETADLLGVSVKTVQREWLTARAWLQKDVAQSMKLLSSL